MYNGDEIAAHDINAKNQLHHRMWGEEVTGLCAKCVQMRFESGAVCCPGISPSSCMALAALLSHSCHFNGVICLCIWVNSQSGLVMHFLCCRILSNRIQLYRYICFIMFP